MSSFGHLECNRFARCNTCIDQSLRKCIHRLIQITNPLLIAHTVLVKGFLKDVIPDYYSPSTFIQQSLFAY